VRISVRTLGVKQTKIAYLETRPRRQPGNERSPQTAENKQFAGVYGK
jgi:hypothetical protein